MFIVFRFVYMGEEGGRDEEYQRDINKQVWSTAAVCLVLLACMCVFRLTAWVLSHHLGAPPWGGLALLDSALLGDCSSSPRVGPWDAPSTSACLLTLSLPGLVQAALLLRFHGLLFFVIHRRHSLIESLALRLLWLFPAPLGAGLCFNVSTGAGHPTLSYSLRFHQSGFL